MKAKQNNTWRNSNKLSQIGEREELTTPLLGCKRASWCQGPESIFPPRSSAAVAEGQQHNCQTLTDVPNQTQPLPIPMALPTHLGLCLTLVPLIRPDPDPTPWADPILPCSSAGGGRTGSLGT